MPRQTRADYLAALKPILDMFRSGDIPEATERTLLKEPDGNERPIDRWSFNNQLLAWAARTEDARTFKQWKTVGRHVLGPSDFRIWAPIMVPKATGHKGPDGKPLTRMILIGYRTIPEFRIENTDGDPVPEHIDEPKPANAPPLMEVANVWKMNVIYAWAKDENLTTEFNGGVLLHSHDLVAFFSALAHEAHKRFKGKDYKDVEGWKKKVVAEIATAALIQHVGLDAGEPVHYPQIDAYAREAGFEPLEAVLQTLRDVKGVMSQITTARAEAVMQSLAGLPVIK